MYKNYPLLSRNLLLCLFSFICCILAPNPISAQTVETAWISKYNGPGNNYDEATGIAIDGEGNVYVTGYSFGSDTTGNDYATVKYNSDGVEQWVQRYNGPGNGDDYAYAIAVDGEGNVYVSGSSFGSTTDFDYATLKYNSDGVEQWTRRYDGPAHGGDWASSLAVDEQGNVYVTGGDYSSGNTDFATLKYDSAGNEKWIRRYNGPGNSLDACYSIAVDGSGNVFVTGESYNAANFGDYVTIKYNSAGDTLWLRRYDGPDHNNEQPYHLVIDGQSNVYVTGASYGGSGFGMDYATLKYNSDGDSLWVRRYNGPGSDADIAFSIAVDEHGNVYVTGESWSGTTDDIATIKYNSVGAEQWVQRYNGPGNNGDYGRSVAVDGQGNVYVTGWSFASDTTGDDYATIKYDSAGVEQWVQKYNGPGNGDDHAWPLAVDKQGNVYVTGVSYNGSHSLEDYTTIKYVQTPGDVRDEGNGVNTSGFVLSRNYPNPFNPTTKIKYSVPRISTVQITIYDVLGNKIETILNEEKPAGTYELTWNAANLSSGIYFYRIKATPVGGQAGDPPASSGQVFIQTKKMILLK